MRLNCGAMRRDASSSQKGVSQADRNLSHLKLRAPHQTGEEGTARASRQGSVKLAWRNCVMWLLNGALRGGSMNKSKGAAATTTTTDYDCDSATRRWRRVLIVLPTTTTATAAPATSLPSKIVMIKPKIVRPKPNRCPNDQRPSPAW